VIAGAGESPYSRRPGPGTTVESLLADAARGALDDAGLAPRDVDGLAVSSFTLAPDGAAELAWKLGLRLSWLLDDRSGGACGISMLRHAERAVAAGDARVVLCVAGDLFSDFAGFARGFNSLFAAPDFNALFALLTQRHARVYGLTRADYATIPLAQRAWAAENENAVYREPLTLEEYLAAPIVAEPLCRYDCPPVVAGADAVVVARDGAVGVRAIQLRVNADQQEGDGLTTGLEPMGTDVDLVWAYDDYPAVVLVQLADLGFGAPRDVLPRIADRSLRLNVSGGQLSAGQAGVAGGMHGLVHAVRALKDGAAGTALVSGYGMAIYRHGSIAGTALLETA
jgi:acetyl-CoA acetyltransferase